MRRIKLFRLPRWYKKEISKAFKNITYKINNVSNGELKITILNDWYYLPNPYASKQYIRHCINIIASKYKLPELVILNASSIAMDLVAVQPMSEFNMDEIALDYVDFIYSGDKHYVHPDPNTIMGSPEIDIPESIDYPIITPEQLDAIKGQNSGY